MYTHLTPPTTLSTHPKGEWSGKSRCSFHVRYPFIRNHYISVTLVTVSDFQPPPSASPRSVLDSQPSAPPHQILVSDGRAARPLSSWRRQPVLCLVRQRTSRRVSQLRCRPSPTNLLELVMKRGDWVEVKSKRSGMGKNVQTYFRSTLGILGVASHKAWGVGVLV